LYDVSDNYIVTDDVASGRGLARPYLPIMLGNVAPPDATTSLATFTPLVEGMAAVQHPVLFAYLLVWTSDASTAGEVRLMVSGEQQGPTLTVQAGEYA